MGESKKKPLRVEFDKSVKLEFHGAKISSDAGLMLHRELDEVLGLEGSITRDTGPKFPLQSHPACISAGER